MKLDRARLPLGILFLVIVLIGVKTLFNPSNKPTVQDDGTVYYKKSGVSDDYLYKINDTIAFEARLIPTMGAIGIDVVSYKKVGGIEGFLMGSNKHNMHLFNPSYMSGDWVFTTYAKQGEYYALNLKTGELVKNETTNENVYETDAYKAKFPSHTTLEDRYVLKNFDYISTYKGSGADLLWAGIFLGGICIVWFLIAALVDWRKPRKAKVAASASMPSSGNRAPGN